ncbi:hypothetical protein GCM10010411_91140 [Actinomadura fulvescens]|uniref:Uncharacterized protein n=1 Tax=Actinomadura fulvescens TaxID=46160 RepID=A0ABN3QXF4_9ACTN
MQPAAGASSLIRHAGALPRDPMSWLGRYWGPDGRWRRGSRASGLTPVCDPEVLKSTMTDRFRAFDRGGLTVERAWGLLDNGLGTCPNIEGSGGWCSRRARRSGWRRLGR